MEITIKFLELFKGKIEDICIQNILPTFYTIMKKQNPTPKESLYGICVFDAFLDLSS